MRRLKKVVVIYKNLRLLGVAICVGKLCGSGFTRIEPRRCRLANDIGDRLGEIIDAEKLSGRPVRLVRSRVAAKAVKLLFKELVQELSLVTELLE